MTKIIDNKIFNTNDDDQMQRIDLRAINSFLDVARSETVREVAKRHKINASTITSRIKRLEEVLGLNENQSLFVKHGTSEDSTMTLTELGKEIFPQAVQIERHFRVMKDGVRRERQHISPVRIGIQNSIHRVLCARIIENLLPFDVDVRTDEGRCEIKTMPHLEFKALRPEELLEELELGAIDIAISQCVQNATLESLRFGYDIQNLYQEEIVLVTSDPECRTIEDIARPDPATGRGSRFLSIDWGSQYQTHQDYVFSDHPNMIVDLTFNRSTAALEMILKSNADGSAPHYCAAFFPRRRIQKYLHEVDQDKIYVNAPNDREPRALFLVNAENDAYATDDVKIKDGHPLKREIYRFMKKRQTAKKRIIPFRRAATSLEMHGTLKAIDAAIEQILD